MGGPKVDKAKLLHFKDAKWWETMSFHDDYKGTSWEETQGSLLCFIVVWVLNVVYFWVYTLKY